MNITILPASTQVGKAVIELLLLQQDSQHHIRAIYRNVSKAPADFSQHANFDAVHGGLDEGMELDFADSDAVFFVPPPTYDEQTDSVDHATRAANKVKAALQRATRVQRLVILSAFGAQHSDGIGILKINHITDTMLAKAAPQVVQIRPGWFQENWLEALQTARNDAPFFETHFTPADHPIPMVSIADTASIVVQHVVETGSALPTSPYAFEIHGPRGYSMLDLQHALATVTGRALPRIDAIEPDRLIDFFKRKLPASKAREVAEMTLALNGGGLLAAQMAGEIGHGAVRGETELVDTLSRLQSGEVAKAASGAF